MDFDDPLKLPEPDPFLAPPRPSLRDGAELRPPDLSDAPNLLPSYEASQAPPTRPDPAAGPSPKLSPGDPGNVIAPTPPPLRQNDTSFRGVELPIYPWPFSSGR
jgi:hypothetical protein